MRACVPRRVGPRSLPYLPIARGVPKAPLALVPDTLKRVPDTLQLFSRWNPQLCPNAQRALSEIGSPVFCLPFVSFFGRALAPCLGGVTQAATASGRVRFPDPSAPMRRTQTLGFPISIFSAFVDDALRQAAPKSLPFLPAVDGVQFAFARFQP